MISAISAANFYSLPKVELAKRFDYRHLLNDNIMLNSKLGDKYRAVEKINLNGSEEEFEFGVATKPEEIKEILKLRFFSYSGEGFIDTEYFNEEMEFDLYDVNAVMAFARNRRTKNINACVRLVLDSIIGFPMEEFVSIRDFKSEKRVISEISRLVSYPKGQRPVNRAILRFAYNFARDMGISHLVGFGRVEKMAYYESIGLRILEPIRKVRYREIGNGHMPPGEFYVNVLDLKNADLNIS